MKKEIVLLCIFVLILIIIFSKFSNNREVVNKDNKEKRAIFISYIELAKYIKDKNIEISRKNIDEMIDNISNLGFNMIILQVRSSSDAIYSSKIFPWSSTISTSEGVDPGMDFLEYFINQSHQHNILLYAWINPYRVRTTSNLETISPSNPAYSYINTDYIYVNNGVYYNPSKPEVEDLIVDGVEEVVKNYDVDGILFDDYFYPSNDVDISDYEEYISKHEFIDLKNYHLMIINKMIERVHNVCKKYHKDFGVSPDGNVDNDYNQVFADVITWCSSDKYVDFIMPQIYYGFYNETKSYKKVIDEWDSMVTSGSVRLMLALAFYKVGTFDNYAKSGKEEWLSHDDIIMREIILGRNLKHYDGFSLFRYDYLFDSNLYTDMTIHEIENMKKVLN